MSQPPLVMPREVTALYPADALALEVLKQLEGLDETLNVGRALQTIREIAEGVSTRLEGTATLGDILFTLNDHLFNVLDFHCTSASKAMPQHSMLHRVVQQHIGDPLSLGILYISVGRWLGLPLTGCGFPGRFLVRYQDAHGGVLLDPAAGGIQLQQADLQALLRQQYGEVAIDDIAGGLLADVADNHLVVRLLRRLKRAYLGVEGYLQALQVQERIMRLEPGLPSGYLERGRIYERLECPRAAAEDYSRYLDLLPDADDARPLHHHLSQLLRQPQVLH